MIKVSSAKDLPIVESIMRQIHAEDPSYWPHGLASQHFNGGLYLVQKSASAEPVGFVGWQEIPEDGRNVGYYVIGILPEHRERGFAKSAVTQVMRKMSSRCDEVRAFIMAHNTPSLALAESLSVPVKLEKLAMEKVATGKLLAGTGHLLKGLGVGLVVDPMLHKDKGVAGYLAGVEGADPWAATDLSVNTIAGALASALAARNKLPHAALALGAGVAKTTTGPVVRNQRTANEVADRQVEATNSMADAIRSAAPRPESDGFKVPAGAWLGAGLLGAGGIAAAIFNASRNRKLKERELAHAEEGKVRVTLPTKKPGDAETMVELPFGDLNLSTALRGRLGRDTKRRLHEETKARTRRRKPADPSQPTERELEDAALEQEEEELDKVAALKELAGELYPRMTKRALGAPAPQGSVPTPPQMGQNPALRMQQQEATAKAIQPAPDANPQIMEAQQAAMQAEQAGAQQAAQLEQQAQQAQMEQQQAFQQELMKKETEAETLKLQLEKQKAIAEMNDAQAKADAKTSANAASGEGTQTQALVSNRIKRLQKRVTKAAASAGTPPTRSAGAWTQATPPTPLIPGDSERPAMPAGALPEDPRPLIHLKPEAANIYNKNPGTSSALPPVWIGRHSYGKVGDTLFNLLGKNLLYGQRAPQPYNPSTADMINTPDKMGMISRIMANANLERLQQPGFLS